MKFLLLLCLCICRVVACAQNHVNYAAVDRTILGIPVSETASTAAIAQYINTRFSTEHEKIRAIYSWVTANIRYNTDSMYSINWGADSEAKVTVALRRRKGVCENYAAIFNDISLKSGLRSHVVTGYTKQWGSINRTGHCWAAVFIDNKWYLCDPTWDEGFRNDAKYFLRTPEEFISTHMPFDPLWQLLPYPITQRDFASAYRVAKKNPEPFAFSDSALYYVQLNELQQQEATARRMQQAGIENDMQKNWFALVKMKIAIVYGENDMELYNSAVADLNQATATFNAYVQYRNNHFTPAKPDTEISAMLEPIAGSILTAWEKINQIGRIVHNFQYDTSGLSHRLVTLTARVQEQQNFLKKYFDSSVADRGKLFYK